MGDLSEHFSRSEFRCKGTGQLPHDAVLLHLVQHLEQLRSLAGDRPLRILSGYRTPSHNRTVGGARFSRHLEGDAVDIRPGYCTVAQAAAAGFRGIGTKRGKPTHIDLRPSPARWSYGR